MRSENWKYSYVLMLISPVIALYVSLKSVSRDRLKWILILFVTLYGAILRLSGTSDGVNFQNHVYEFYLNKDFATFFHELYRILIFDPLPGTKGDVYIHLVSFFCGSVLHMPGSFFTVVGFVFGYFHISGLYKVYEFIPREGVKSILVKTAIVVFVSFLTIDMMQSVRTWTGAWILFNGVVGYHQTGKYKYILLMLCAPLVHVAFFLMVLPSIFVIFGKKLKPVFFVIPFFLSFFVNTLPASITSSIKSTAIGASKLDSYQVYDEEGNLLREIDQVNIGRQNFYAKYGKGASPKIGTTLLLFIFIILGLFNKKKMTSLEYAMFCTAILSASFANASSFIPQLEGRLYVITGLFTTGVTVLFLQRQSFEMVDKKKQNWREYLFWGAFIVFIPKVIYVMANMIQYTSMFMLAFPVFGVVLGDGNLSIRELIGFILWGE